MKGSWPGVGSYLLHGDRTGAPHCLALEIGVDHEDKCCLTDEGVRWIADLQDISDAWPQCDDTDNLILFKLLEGEIPNRDPIFRLLDLVAGSCAPHSPLASRSRDTQFGGLAVSKQFVQEPLVGNGLDGYEHLQKVCIVNSLRAAGFNVPYTTHGSKDLSC